MSIRWLLAVFILTASGAASLRAQDTPAEPKGVEVLTRGPVHEAFASLASEPTVGQPVPKKPPQALDELPPDERPAGDVIWISGYWHWDDDRNDFLWVSGVWRKVPQGKRWVSGYWREDGDRATWVGGFWANDSDKDSEDVVYLPQPPALPKVAPPGEPPQPDTFYVPGHWVWNGVGYSWKSGYWAAVQKNQVWVPAHYRWTPSGYVFVPGYWDYAIADRGVMYAPVYVDVVAVGPSFVYTPAYVVRETVVLDSLFVRPACCHYYFGDYYGPRYRTCGFESCVVYSRRCYDPIIVYQRWEQPRWEGLQIELVLARDCGRAPCPPRTLVQQNVVVQKNVTNITNVTNVTNVTNIHPEAVVVPAKQLGQAKGITTVAVDAGAKAQAVKQAQMQQQVARERKEIEVAHPPTKANQPRVGALSVARPKSLMAADVKADAVRNAQSGPDVKGPGTNAPTTPVKPTVVREPIRNEGVKRAGFTPPDAKPAPATKPDLPAPKPSVTPPGGTLQRPPEPTVTREPLRPSPGAPPGVAGKTPPPGVKPPTSPKPTPPPPAKKETDQKDKKPNKPEPRR